MLPIPNFVKDITSLVGQILIKSETSRSRMESSELYLFYNRPIFRAIFAPVNQRLLPLDDTWGSELTALPWLTGNLPEVIGSDTVTLRDSFVSIFVSLFRACAESLASKNGSRLATMQRADKIIDLLLENLHRHFRQMRQSGIDEELVEVISGFKTLAKKTR